MYHLAIWWSSWLPEQLRQVITSRELFVHLCYTRQEDVVFATATKILCSCNAEELLVNVAKEGSMLWGLNDMS